MFFNLGVISKVLCLRLGEDIRQLDSHRLALSLIVLCGLYCLNDIISNLLQQFYQIT